MFSWVTFEHLKKWTGGELPYGGGEQKVQSISTDSRSIQADQVFLALKGENFDGHRFLDAVLASGAQGVISEKEVPRTALWLKVSDTLLALQNIGIGLRKSFTRPVIAVTGSAGKSSTKEMIGTLLGKSAVRSPASFNNLIGVSRTHFLLEDSTEYLVLEMGMNALGEIRHLCECFVPDAGLITNIGDAHIGKVGGAENLYRAKKEMFDSLASRNAKLALNVDDPRVVRAYEEAFQSPPSAKVTYSDKGNEADVRVLSRKMDPDNGQLKLRMTVRGEPLEVSLPIFGQHQSQNIAAAVASVELLGVPRALWEPRLREIRPASHRGEIHQVKGGAVLVDESYNSNPTALGSALDSFFELESSRSKLLVLGEMQELGSYSEELHRKVGAHLSSLISRAGGQCTVFGVGPGSAHLLSALEGSPATVQHFPSVKEVTPAVKALVTPETVILVKGSRGNALDLLVDSLLS